MIHYSHIKIILSNTEFNIAQGYIELFLSEFDPNHMMIETVSKNHYVVHAFVRDDENTIMTYQELQQHVMMNEHVMRVEPLSLGNVVASVMAMRNCTDERYIMYELDAVC